MSDRPARIRLMLDSGSYLGGLHNVARESESIGKRISKGLGDWRIAGLDRVGGTLAGIAQGAQNAIKWGAGLGGAFTVGGAIKDAVELTDTYRSLAFAVEAGTGKATRWQGIQADVEGAAGRWSKSNADVAASYKALWDETGDLEYTRAAVESVAKASRATGKDTAVFASLAGTLYEKFGIGSKDIDSSTAALIELGNKGGISLEDMSEKLGIVGASARQMGKSGIDGLKFALGMFNLADNATGSMKKATAATAGLMDELGNSDKMKQIQKELHIKLVSAKGEIAPDAIEKILAKTGGRREMLAKVFTGESLKLVTELGKPFEAAYRQAKDAGGSTKEAIAAGLVAYRKALEEAGRVTMTAAEVERKAKERLGEPSARLQEALNRMVKAFEQPQMVSAIETVAAQMPKLARGLAALIDFTAKDPWVALPVLMGGLIVKDFAAAGIGIMVKDVLARILGSVPIPGAPPGGVPVAGPATEGAVSATAKGAATGATAAKVAPKAASWAARAKAALTATKVGGIPILGAALMVAAGLMTSGDEGSLEERKAKVKATEKRAQGGAKDRYAESYRRAREAIERAKAEQSYPEIQRTAGPQAFPMPVTTGGGGSDLQRQVIRALNPEAVRTEGKAAARAHRELADAAGRAARALDSLRTPPGQPPGGGGGRGAANGLPPHAPRTPGYAPR